MSWGLTQYDRLPVCPSASALLLVRTYLLEEEHNAGARHLVLNAVLS